MFYFISKKIKFIFKSFGYYLPFISTVADKIFQQYLKFEFSFLFRNCEFIFYPLNKNRKIKLYKKSFLTKLILNDFEYEELCFIKRILKKDDIVFDIGANIGVYSLLCSDYVGENGKVFAFEPVESTYNLLLENIQNNKLQNIITCNKAISDCSDEQLKIYENSNGYDAFDSAVKSILTTAQEIIVNTITIDDYIDQNNIDVSKIKLIKIDVEGWEFKVLKGAEKLIKRQLPIAFLVEFSNANNSISISKNESVYNYMKSNNYNWFMYNVPAKKLVSFHFDSINSACNLIAVNEHFRKNYNTLF